MANWVRVASTAECPAGEGREFVAAGRIVAVFHAAGQFYALDGICPHQGGPIGRGVLRDCLVTCPWHGWQFDVRTGQQQISAAVRQPCYAVKVEAGEIYVDLG